MIPIVYSNRAQFSVFKLLSPSLLCFEFVAAATTAFADSDHDGTVFFSLHPVLLVH